MVCKSCGNEIRDDAKFCPHCGAVSGAPAGAPYVPSGYAGPEAPVPGQGKGKKGLIIGGIAAVIVVAILAAVFASGLFSNPKKQVTAAFAKTAAAYSAVSDSIGLPDLNGLRKHQSISQRFSFELNSINSSLTGYDMSALSGLGVRMDTNLDGESRKLDASLSAYWGGDDLLSFRLLADGSKLYLSSPQFTDGTAYGVNTETLGADLEAMTGDGSVADISFNIFDLMDLAMEQMDPEAMKQELKEANKALWEAAEVKKLGAKSLSVNGTETKTSAYQVVFPQDALYQYVDELETVLSAVDYYELYAQLFQATGMPQEEIQDFLDQLEELDVYGELADSLRDVVEQLGDVHLTVHVGGGYVSALVYESYLDNGRDSFLSLSLFLGGGEEYVDNLRLELKVDDQMIIVDSTGDHGCKSGVFTDKTVIKGPIPAITSDLQYDPKGGGLQWNLSVNGAGSLDMMGQLSMGEDSVDLQMDDIALRVMGLEVCSFGMDYYMGPCQGVDLTGASPKLITEMNMFELMVLASDLENRATTWADSMESLFAQRLPAELYYSLF